MIKKVLILLMIINGFVYAGKIMELPELINPTSMVMDNTRVYFADGPKVLIYSLEKSKLIKKIGQEGDGPGEFRDAPNWPILMHLYNENIIISSFGKISIYTKEGIFKKEIRNKSFALNLVPCGKLYVGKGFAQDKGKGYITVNIYDEQLKKIKEIYREKASFQRGSKNKFDPVDATGPGIASDNTHIFLNIGNNRDTIAAFGQDGKKSYSFTHNFREIELTEEHRKRYMSFLETDPNFRDFVARTKHLFRFNDLFPLIQKFFIDEGKIFATSYENNNGVRNLYVFTLKGQFIKQLEIPLVSQNVDTPYPFTTCKGKLYQIVENEEAESWGLFVHSIDIDKP